MRRLRLFARAAATLALLLAPSCVSRVSPLPTIEDYSCEPPEASPIPIPIVR